MKKVISALAALAVLMTATLTVSATHIGRAAESIGSAVSDALLRAEFEELCAAQQNAVDAYDTLYRSFFVDDKKTYPENYGGAHIENNILYIHIVNLENQDVTPYQILLADYLADVKFVEAEYSLNALQAAAVETYKDFIAQGIEVVNCGVSEKNNAVSINIDSSEVSKLSLLTRAAPENQYYVISQENSDVPVYIGFESKPSACIVLQGGTRLVGYTLGICGTYQGRSAFAMCGHGISGIGQRIYHQLDNGTTSTQLGTVLEHQFAHYENGDFAIVSNSGNLSTRALMGNPNLLDDCFPVTGTTLVPPEGTIVVKYGSRAGFAYGRVEGQYFNTPIEGLDGEFANNIICGLVKVTMTSGRVQGGDSGGPVFTGTGVFCGIISAGYLHNNNNTPYDVSDDYGTVSYYFSPYEYLNEIGFEVQTT